MANPIGTISYALAAAAFLFLAGLLITSWRGRLQGLLLAFGSIASAAWAGICAYLAARPGGSMFAGEVLEALRDLAWFAFLLVLLGYLRKDVRLLRAAAAGIALYFAVGLAVPVYLGGASVTRRGVYGFLGLVP